MSDLKTAATELHKALGATEKALEKYYFAALAAGRESGDPTARGLDSRQIRSRLKTEVIAWLSARGAIIDLDGAPQARRYVAAYPLLGLA